MKKVLAMGLAMCLLLGISGCKRAETQMEADDSIDFANQPALEEKIIDGVTINAEVHIPAAFESGKGNIYENLRTIGLEETQKLEELFLKDKKIVEKQESKERAMINYFIEAEGETEPFLALHIDNYYWGVFTPVGETIEDYALYSFEDNKAHDMLSEEYLQDTDFTFATRQQAFEEIRKTLWTAGSEIADEYQCYAIPHTLSASKEKELLESEEFIKPPKSFGEWTEEQDCYYFELAASVDGYPITRYDHGNSNDGSATDGERVPGFYSNVIYSKDGIIKSKISTLSQEEPSQAGLPLITAEQALETVKKYYEEMGTTISAYGKEEIRGVYLEMLPLRQDGKLDSFQLVPAWRFDVWGINPAAVETDGTDIGEQAPPQQQERPLFINALTGERIR